MKYTLTAACLLTIGLTGVRAQQPGTIVETAVSASKFDTLVAAVKAAGLAKTLSGKGPFTVFAPTDEAFKKLPQGTLESLLKPENKGKLASILTYHVVPGRVMAKDVFGLDTATTVNGQRLDVKFAKGKLTVDGAKVVATDIDTSNGVIHVIDTVMLPEFNDIPTVATKAGQFKTLLAAVKAAGLAETLSGKGPFTVFAPTDAAFKKLPEGTLESLLKPENKDKLVNILKYHVVSGRVYADQAIKAGEAKTLLGQGVEVTFGSEGVKVNDSGVVGADVEASNGVIHVIDQVLLPKTLSSKDARQKLEKAVRDGSNKFNHGDAHACARIYAETCREIVEMGSTLDPMATRILSGSLARTSHLKSEKEKAWVLRHGIEMSYTILARD